MVVISTARTMLTESWSVRRWVNPVYLRGYLIERSVAVVIILDLNHIRDRLDELKQIRRRGGIGQIPMTHCF